MIAVEVYKCGKFWTKIKSGETVAEAKRRLGETGVLESKDGLALTNDDFITVDGAPYAFKPSKLPPKSIDEIDYIDRLISTCASHWAESEVRLGKRKRQTDTLPPSSKKSAVSRAKASEALLNDRNAEEEESNEAADDSKMEVYPPSKMLKWYRGKEGQFFYLRPCVSDLGHLILERAESVLNDEKGGATTFVISGAAGIGKSWSINAFMTVLLDSKKKVFFHSGQYARAWTIEANKVTRVAPVNIDALDKDWIYVYDSPGSTKLDGDNRAAEPRTGHGLVSLIFSSPKRGNYEHATKKSDGPVTIFNLPTWTKLEMLDVDRLENSRNANAINACYDIWGGNMRALNKFIPPYQENATLAIQKAEEELSTHIRKIDKEFAKKMVANLEKQDVEDRFAGEDVQDSPGHILVPEPIQTDTAIADCFEQFRWHFCSPLAEKKFFRHMKEQDKDMLKELLVSVFQVPSPRGVLFQKVAHHLVTNGIVENFRCYPYNEKNNVGSIQFQRCVEEISFEGEDQLEANLREAVEKLDDKIGTIALEPKNTSFDAVDMFVVERQETTGKLDGWCLYMLQDTISKTHSFHPIKIMWYCSVFCAMLKEKFALAESNDLLNCCKYIPVVPHETRDFSFKTATATCNQKELDAVAGLLGFEWHSQYNDPNPNCKTVVDLNSLCDWIPKTKDGNARKRLDKKMVGNAMLMKEGAATRVESMCQVIFNVVNSTTL